ncbi:group II intron reverse transcriptase/maturase [Clostridium perfringens]|uniref:group II intron reverse transcriptase/maturase n=1 Tax=Clostridium perfringens TaxID=1502 RepID=UPI001DD281CB|nr:group II intron reverse transcriptase/maturase [Clostridium perfringens]MDU5777368.1 group II intron reverse transcriptase/maturase [Clostridium perfringens]
MKESFKLKKRQILRNNEYYSIQNIFDELYEKSKHKYKFNKLMEIIESKENILLAYRNIKKNKGSVTSGTDNINIDFYKNTKQDEFIKTIQNKLKNYFPKSVRRVEIPKKNGKTRPLGIPCMEDRLIQQCIKQVLEPICEAKFYKHSYGFRPNRSTKHAIARLMHLINQNKLHYVVDIDIKGFFDNVNHSKLKKQMWSIGIRDKNLISIIGKILKSEIKGIGVPTKGTPQGGILSPLLSNIVLNELDWWISSQWETIKTKHDYSLDRTKEGKGIDFSGKYRALKKSTNLKEMYIVRYADDFKVCCRDYKSAQKIYKAIKLWLKERLELDISSEKSKITNLRKNYTEFLGFKLKAKIKKNKYICKSKMSNKAKEKVIENLKKQIKRIKKKLNTNEVKKLNSIILGVHNYYNCATHIVIDMSEINFLVSRTLFNRLSKSISRKPNKSKAYEKFYGKYNGKVITICGISIFPIYGCKTKIPLRFNQTINNYTMEGRKIIHEKLKGYEHLIEYLLRVSYEKGNTELEDNKISLIAGQNGKCFITGRNLNKYEMECHHKKPRKQGGKDDYKNLVWLCYEAHKLVHSTKIETINKYLNILNLDEKGLKRVNSLRELVGNSAI